MGVTGQTAPGGLQPITDVAGPRLDNVDKVIQTLQPFADFGRVGAGAGFADPAEGSADVSQCYDHILDQKLFQPKSCRVWHLSPRFYPVDCRDNGLMRR